MKRTHAFLIIAIVIILDQALKIWVKTHMMLSEEHVIANWFRIHFTENAGMAFGMLLPGVWGKIFLSVFRLFAVVGGLWYLNRIIREKAHWGFVAAVSLILAGAFGNMIDGTFYGVIFSDSQYAVAKMFPPEGGYSGWMQGLVVDMLWFPLFHGYWPKWVPFVGGDYFEFFRFIFNIADASITIGVAIIILFQRAFFKKDAVEETKAPAAEQQAQAQS
ncbi:MAG: lipoprotein signal peptidase [Chitinophagales bacterium]